MNPETENSHEAKSVYLGNPAQHAYAEPGRSIMLVFLRDGSYSELHVYKDQHFEKNLPTRLCTHMVC